MTKKKLPLYGFSDGASREGRPKAYKHMPIFKGEAKKHKVDRIMDVLKDWHLSPFENEGAVRSSVRSSLCLRGYSWQAAENEAITLINAAFMIMGVERPTWEQGQREYVEPRENCKWCGKPMPSEYLTSGKKIRFCSATCAKAAFQQRSFEDKTHYNHVRAEVYRIFKRENSETKICATCGKHFKPDRTCKGLYCSMECASLAHRTVPDKTCLNCGKTFRKGTKHTGIKFCSKACWTEYQANKTPLARCDYCRKLYHKKVEHARFCSTACRCKMSELVTGRRIPKRLTAPVFDFFFSRAV